ncbi:MAG: hypothetical protein ACRC1T_05235 [Clostridium chrysemydis]|uniref:hypothetical protein n=1 Tax=Clostridium chrysemydis TaxID=2665504 RepID=UPI003F3EA4B1
MEVFQCDECGEFFNYEGWTITIYGNEEDNWEFGDDTYNPYDNETLLCDNCCLEENYLP